MDALDFAFQCHRKQKRNYSEGPYIIHPLRVAERLRNWGVSDPDTINAAYCHDILEDCNISYMELESNTNTNVAQIVQELTLYSGERKDDYLKSFIEKSPRAIVIKVADRVDNSLDYLASNHNETARSYFRSAYNLFFAFHMNAINIVRTFDNGRSVFYNMLEDTYRTERMLA